MLTFFFFAFAFNRSTWYWQDHEGEGRGECHHCLLYHNGWLRVCAEISRGGATHGNFEACPNIYAPTIHTKIILHGYPIFYVSFGCIDRFATSSVSHVRMPPLLSSSMRSMLSQPSDSMHRLVQIGRYSAFFLSF